MPFEPYLKKLRYHWTDVYKKKGAGFGWNFPNVGSIPFPFIRLDYFLVKGDIKAKAAKVLPNSSSDHLAVWAEIVF